jgi:hypothetical protein
VAYKPPLEVASATSEPPPSQGGGPKVTLGRFSGFFNFCRKLKKELAGERTHFVEVCGLQISTYFSAVKLLWLMENVDAVMEAANQSRGWKSRMRTGCSMKFLNQVCSSGTKLCLTHGKGLSYCTVSYADIA